MSNGTTRQASSLSLALGVRVSTLTLLGNRLRLLLVGIFPGLGLGQIDRTALATANLVDETTKTAQLFTVLLLLGVVDLIIDKSLRSG
jgi:hypothetical protein